MRDQCVYLKESYSVSQRVRSEAGGSRWCQWAPKGRSFCVREWCSKNMKI